MPEPTSALSIGGRVKFHRLQLGLTQHGLAQRLNRSVTWVRNIEQGRTQVDSVTVILELADVWAITESRRLRASAIS